MRLLNVETLRFTSFPGANLAPPYAILSHRWEDNEVLFEDLQDDPLEDLVASLEKCLELLERKQASDKPHLAVVQPPLEDETSIHTMAAHETGEISELNSVWTAFKGLDEESYTKETPNETLADDISSHRDGGRESELPVEIQFQLNDFYADYDDLLSRLKNAVPEESFEGPFKAKRQRGFGKGAI